MADTARLAHLLAEVEAFAAHPVFTEGIRGLRLNLDFLRSKGADEYFLDIWTTGRPLLAEDKPHSGIAIILLCLRMRSGPKSNGPVWKL